MLLGAGSVQSGGARRQLRRPARRAQVDRWLLRLPLVGELLAKIDTARFARALGTLLANGVPPLTALAIVQDALANATLRRALGDAATAMKDGGGLAAPLGRSGVFPRLAVHLWASARNRASSTRCCSRSPRYSTATSGARSSA